MEKTYERIKWENYPSVLTPLNEHNLNKMDSALDEVDNRILGLDTAKVDKSTVNTMVKDVSFDEATGVFTVTLLDGTTKELDTKLEKIATNFRFDYESQKLILTLSDGSEQEIDLSSLISQYEFLDGDIISFAVDSIGKVSAIVKDGSITEEKLQPNFLADVKVEVEKAKSHSDSSYDNASIASTSAQEAKQYRDETEQFRNEVEAIVNVDIATTEKAGIVKPDGATIRVDEDGTIHADNGTVDYNELENKPQINGVELSGSKSLSDLGIASANDLEKVNFKVDTVIENVPFTIKNTASGENLHLTDSANGKAVDFGLYGKAEQKQYSGKNLIPYPYLETNHVDNGITWSVDENGVVTGNGTATGNATFLCRHRISGDANPLILQAGTYILSGFPSGQPSTAYMNVATNNSDGSILNIVTTRGGDSEFTLSEESQILVGITVTTGTTINNLVVKPMIRLASITDDTFEPYVGGIASPNPDYPQEITVSGSDGSVEVKSVGKNLIPYPYNGITSGTGITWTEKDGVITANGTSSGNSTYSINVRLKSQFNGTELFLDKGKYILSDGMNNGSTTTYHLAVNGYQNGNDETSSQVLLASTYATGNKIFEITEDNKLVWCYITVRANYSANNLTFKPMIRKCDDNGNPIGDDVFELYKKTTSTIPTPNGLCGIKVSSGGNYTDENGQQWICDEIVKYADGSGKRVQRINKRVFDGVNNVCGWVGTITGATETLTQMNLNNTDALSLGVYSIVCDKFYVDKTWTSENKTLAYTCRQSTSTGACCCYLKESDGITDKDTANAWLQENPVTVYYILKEPIITDLTAEEIAEIEKLYTFYPVTNISNDADCGMSITYMADAKNYIDNRLALIESAMLNNI